MATTKMQELFNVLTRRARRVGVREFRTLKSKHCFTQFDLLGVLVLKTVTRASYRTLSMLVPSIVGKSMHFTTPHKAAQRFGARLLHRLLVACLPAIRGQVVAIDSTGFSTSQRSNYFDVRIREHNARRGFVKASLLVDTRSKAIIACKIHILDRHDIRDAYQLAPLVQARHLVADKAYDSEEFHNMLSHVQMHVPLRARARKGFWRKKHAKQFSRKIYGKRSLVETVNSVVKRRFGSTLAAKKCVTRRIEVLLKLVTHNLLIIRKSIYYLMISTQPNWP